MAGSGDYFPIGRRRSMPPLRVAAFNAIERHVAEQERLNELADSTIVRAIIDLVLSPPSLSQQESE